MPDRWPQDTGRTVALAGHLGAFVLPLVGALVVQQTEGRKNNFVKHHATEAFNFQLTMVLLAIVNALVSLSLTPATMGVWIIAAVPIHLGIAVSVIACSVVAAQAARRGDWYQYPLSLRLLSGARLQP
jgi:uncharacterized protein